MCLCVLFSVIVELNWVECDVGDLVSELQFFVENFDDQCDYVFMCF